MVKKTKKKRKARLKARPKTKRARIAKIRRKRVKRMKPKRVRVKRAKIKKAKKVRVKPKKKIRKKAKKKAKRRVKRRAKRAAKTSAGRTHYALNPRFELVNELKSLILASPPASLNRMAKRLTSLGKVKLALVSGVFLNKENVADLLIVGDNIDRRRFKNFLKALEAEVGTQIIYAIMDSEEFYYRRAMFDRFVRLLLEGPHEVLIDKIGL